MACNKLCAHALVQGRARCWQAKKEEDAAKHRLNKNVTMQMAARGMVTSRAVHARLDVIQKCELRIIFFKGESGKQG